VSQTSHDCANQRAWNTPELREHATRWDHCVVDSLGQMVRVRGDLDRMHDSHMTWLSPEFPAPSATPLKITLPDSPLLESWERTDHPSQLRLAGYRESIATLAADVLTQLEPPLALGFHVAGRPDIATQGDLDNFLTPVVKALGGYQRFGLVWASRGLPSETSKLTIARAADARLRMEQTPPHAHARLSTSATSVAWKQGLARAVGEHAIAEQTGPVELGIRFGASPQRNWVALWKPAIDSLSGVLGKGHRDWHPRDDRISLLVLKRDLRPQLAWNVELDIWWSEQ
jgi:hypothetical protein